VFLRFAFASLLCVYSLVAQSPEAPPDLAKMKADLFFLAGPECMGRGTGEPGQVKAAAYIAKRMEENGLQPLRGTGMGGASAFHFAYTLERSNLDQSGSKLKIGATDLALGSDAMSLGLAEQSGEVVFLGYGMNRPDLGWDDYANANVKDKWVVIFDGQPRLKEGPFSTPTPVDGSGPLAKYQTASKAGAKGLILLPGNHEGDRDPARTFAQLQAAIERGGLRLKGARVSASSTIYLSPSGAKKIGLDGAALQRAMDESGKPASPKSLGALNYKPSIKRSDVAASNLVGLIPGHDSKLKDEIIVVSAHHDHLGGTPERYFPGADDNASGTTGVLEVARLLKDSKPKRTILFLSVSGEELGLYGSEAFLSAPPIDLKRLKADINLDMIGRNAVDEITVTPARIDNAITTLTQEARRIAEKRGLKLSAEADQYWTRSDHYNFFKRGIPAMFFFAGMHEDYHRISDTPDKINFEKMGKIVSLTRELVLSTANAPQTPQPIAKEVWSTWSWGAETPKAETK
jgi:Peptidase family M28